MGVGGKKEIMRAKREKIFLAPPPNIFREGGKKNVYYTQTIKNTFDMR